MKKILLLVLCVYSLSLKAYEKEFVIKNIPDDEYIILEKLDPEIKVNVGDYLLIYSHSSKNVLGYSRVQTINDATGEISANVVTHNKSGMIRPENYLRRIDLTKDDNRDLTGRFDLMYRERKKVLPQYRPFVYAGLSQGFVAANLLKKEFVVGPSVVAYGITNGFQTSTNIISTIYKVPNFSIKNTLFRNDDYELAVENSFQYYSDSSRGSYTLTAYLDMVSNSQFISYFKLKAFTKKPSDEYIFNSEAYENSLNLEFSFSYGYLLDNWNRIIFGPKIDVNKEKVGGSIGYYIIQKEFHTLIGVTANDFSHFRIGKDGYLINLDFWWRF